MGWIWKPKSAIKEIEEGCPWFTKKVMGIVAPSKIWAFFIKYICPVVISLVLLNALGIFDKKEVVEPAEAKANTEQAALRQMSPEDSSNSESQ